MQQNQRKAIDLAVLVTLFALALSWSIYLSVSKPGSIFVEYNLWYGSDIPRVLANMTDISSNHYRTKVHPIFSFVILPPTKVISYVFGLGLEGSALIVVSIFAAMMVTSVYLAARVVTESKVSAFMIALYLMSSSSYIFWSGVPETFVFGSAAISLVLLASVLGIRDQKTHILLNVAALSFTTTNWFSAILVSLSQLKLRDAIKVMLTGFLVVVVIAVWQKVLIPSSGLFFIPSAVTEEPAYILFPTAENIPKYGLRTLNFFLSSMAAPGPIIADGQIKSSLTFSGAGILALICFAVLFLVGSVRLAYDTEFSSARITLCGFLTFQLLLHIFYGDEPFLYSVHFLPALVLVCSFALRGKNLWLMRMLMFVGACAGLTNNIGQLHVAQSLILTSTIQ
jgi:hypothetical protein